MATITIQKPYTIAVRGDGYFDALPADEKCTIKAEEGQINRFEYVLGANTYTLPTGGTATSTKGTDEAVLDDLSLVDTGGPPPDPFTISFNSGKLSRTPTTGSPFKVEVEDVDADMLITGAASAATYGSGGELRLDAGGRDDPSRRIP